MSRGDQKFAELGVALVIADSIDAPTWAGLFDDYKDMAIKRALSNPPPKIVIHSTADYWNAETLLHAAAKRVKAIEAELAGDCDMRRAADLQAELERCERDYWHIIKKIRHYNGRKAQRKKFWRMFYRASDTEAGGFPVVVHLGGPR